MSCPLGAWTLARAVSGHETNGVAEALPEPYRSMVAHLAAVRIDDALTGLARQAALADARRPLWDAMLAARPDADDLVRALTGVDPSGPPPEPATPPEQCATLADLRRIVADTEWPWPGWLAGGVLNALVADPGTGKTIMAADLARRLWFGQSWPDNQANTLPER